jgi:hypothetical protein
MGVEEVGAPRGGPILRGPGDGGQGAPCCCVWTGCDIARLQIAAADDFGGGASRLLSGVCVTWAA